MSDLATRLTAILSLMITTVANRVVAKLDNRDLLNLACLRILRMRQRLVVLYGEWQAGTLPKPQPARVHAKREAKPRVRFPAKRAWLVGLCGWQTAGAASQLQHLLTEPDAAEFLAAVPQAGRILRPLGQMLGIQLPSSLHLPRRPRKPRPPRPPRPESRSALLRRLRGMTGAELHAWFHPLPPHANLPIPGYRAIRRKIRAFEAAGGVRPL